MLQSEHRLGTVAFKVEALEPSELLHISDVRETFVMQIKLLVQRWGSVVFLPFFLEQFPENLFVIIGDPSTSRWSSWSSP